MKRTITLCCLLLLSGCVAETIERRKPRKGPVKEVGFVDMGGGNVRYSTDGWSWFVSGRRRHALRLMRKNCGKDLAPQILDEYLRQDSDIAYSGEDITTNLKTGMDHFKIAPFQHLIYECREKGAALETLPISTAPLRVVVAPPAVSTPAATVAPSTAPAAVSISTEPAK